MIVDLSVCASVLSQSNYLIHARKKRSPRVRSGF